MTDNARLMLPESWDVKMWRGWAITGVAALSVARASGARRGQIVTSIAGVAFRSPVFPSTLVRGSRFEARNNVRADSAESAIITQQLFGEGGRDRLVEDGVLAKSQGKAKLHFSLE
ncbi:hypothetical protein B0T21DRAFT_349332 [Apiosordaria backusii]|uniref:Uncharacterized protein n=1 Tax=Apiosordaria backusii TaxID=314023 RepID=A0AA40BKL3_9PEZI|nr:hypothetical protein B0T21DRAFT_349332 [Apiosordaria backusii]